MISSRMCRRLPVVFGLWGGAHTASTEPARWDVDPHHSLIEWRVAHMVISQPPVPHK